jgi:hypothetical protein|tara:strand:+ start:402 stop:1046 length:645 start_codon:yes stop_codon:yes gene_type:complete
MKIKEYNEMMRYLTRPSDKQKGKFVKVRKPNAVPPKTKTIQKFNRGGKAEPYGKVKIMPDPTSDLGFTGLTVEDDIKLRDLKYDETLGRFVNKRTGKTGSLNDLMTLNQFDSKQEEEKYFEPILDRLKIKGSKKKIVKKPKPPAEDKPKPTNVIPLPIPSDAPLSDQNWYKSNVPDETFEEFYARRIKEEPIEKRLEKEAFKIGLGTLFRKKLL